MRVDTMACRLFLGALISVWEAYIAAADLLVFFLGSVLAFAPRFLMLTHPVYGSFRLCMYPHSPLIVQD